MISTDWRVLAVAELDWREVLTADDGIELQSRIRHERPELPIVFVTAHDDDDVRRRAMRDGAMAFMLKPFDGGELLEHIARATHEG